MTTSPHFLQLHDVDGRAMAEEAAAGLGARRAHVSPKFLYDPLGSRLFDAITELAEYYPTRTEASIHAAQGAAIVEAALASTGPAPVLVDLGAGNCAKAAQLFGRLAPRRYVAVDISLDFLRQSLCLLQREHPGVEMTGVALDFSSCLELPPGVADGPALVLYPGSSIGNFSPDEAMRLLREARALAAGGGLLIGVDLVKPVEVLEAAYDDPLGVTAAFNLNLLNNLNRLLGADFDLRQWRHVALFDERASRIEMHLEARVATRVRWPGGERRFAAGERIHTENSYKWTPDAFEALLRQAGFGGVRCWTDPLGWFGVFLATG
ncbi:MAG TPA: L-histidine N(alpha)-methyltransferase [Quisquiliibacterium sp.]|nr:L-histidine N(alpha)-methyltransferase [Quisquiliibacterium sp.]